jgi:type IV pilus assembly protein PilV
MLNSSLINPMPQNHNRQKGASLIEVLVAILLLSFGMLSLGAMLSFAVQAPKLSGYRAIATNLANDHVERIRANPAGFAGGSYKTASSYDGSTGAISTIANPCSYAGTQCTDSTLADLDDNEVKQLVRLSLPSGGMQVTCDPVACGVGAYGNLWIMWEEPSTVSVLNAANTDNCPASVAAVSPKPRCLYVRFKL